MDINVGNKDGITVVQLSGNLDSNSSSDAQDRIMPLAVDQTSLILDLEGCKYISSAGLRVLLMIAKELSSQGGKCALAGLCEEVKDIMEMTGFSGFFESYDTVTNAIDAIK